MNPGVDAVIKLLTMATLGGLLFSTGLRLAWNEIAASLRKNRIAWILPVNFLVVPAMTFALARVSEVETDTAVGMAILAAAPFAPVVPTFARLAGGDLALAGALTGLSPFLSAFATPLVCELSLKPLLGSSSLRYEFAPLLLVLVSTISLPLAAGVGVHHCFPAIAGRLLKPIQVVSEAVGAVSLIYAVAAEFHTIRMTGWKPLLAMALLSELSFLIGYATSGPARRARLVVALGTANRNIALALLVAVQSFPGTRIVGVVVANGLLIIFLGLLHVGWWRLRVIKFD